MASHSQKGSVTIDAVQWLPPATTIASIQASTAWTKRLDLQTPDGVVLHVRTIQGMEACFPTDWIYMAPDNRTIDVIPNSLYTQLYV
jgi:hypothetical protein